MTHVILLSREVGIPWPRRRETWLESSSHQRVNSIPAQAGSLTFIELDSNSSPGRLNPSLRPEPDPRRSRDDLARYPWESHVCSESACLARHPNALSGYAGYSASMTRTTNMRACLPKR